MTTALVVAGVRKVYASYWPGSGILEEDPATIWLASDIGLIRADVRGATEPLPLGTSRGAKLAICPWVDVVNPELTVEAINLGHGPLTLIVAFKIQIPRLDIESAGDPKWESSASRLARFGGAVLRHTR